MSRVEHWVNSNLVLDIKVLIFFYEPKIFQNNHQNTKQNQTNLMPKILSLIFQNAASLIIDLSLDSYMKSMMWM